MRRWFVLLLVLIAFSSAPAQAWDEPLHENAWCFNVLFNLGVRHGLDESYHEHMAAFAMAETRGRTLAIAEQTGLDKSALEALDKQYFDEGQGIAARLADGTADETLVDRFDRCRAKGLSGVQMEKRLAAFLEANGARLWCRSVFSSFLSRNMMREESRAARAREAVAALEQTLDTMFFEAGIASSDKAALIEGYEFLGMVQAIGYSITGDKGRFERDYEPCFAMTEIRMAGFTMPAAERRPVRDAAAWDYPLSFDFRFNIWCEAQLQAKGGLGERMNAQGIAEVGEATARALSTEAELLGIAADDLAQMRRDSLTQVEYEIARDVETGRPGELSYGPNECGLIGVERALDALFPDETTAE